MSAGIQPLFSPRQTDVLTLAAAGCTERETALRLGIASATVRGHLARARESWGAEHVSGRGAGGAPGLIEV